MTRVLLLTALLCIAAPFIFTGAAFLTGFALQFLGFAP